MISCFFFPAESVMNLFVNLFPNRNGILKKLSAFFAYFSIKAVVEVAYLNFVNNVIIMSTHNIAFHKKVTK